MSYYYALWVNRNGQHHWSGPHISEESATVTLGMILDKSGGDSFVVKRVPERRAAKQPESYPDLSGATVTCRACGKTYVCTPVDDYFGDPDEPSARDATSGRCWPCMLRGEGVNPDTTPVTVMDGSGRELDPREGHG